MIGLYFLAIVFVWIVLTFALSKRLWKWRQQCVEEQRLPVSMASLVIIFLWLGVSWYYAGGRALLVDLEVNRLCKIDGGIRVYETVTLLPEMLDEKGRFRLASNRFAEPEDQYYWDWVDEYQQKGNPELRRSHIRIWNKQDGKLLGEGISYHRVGGSLPGPWMPSSFVCPERAGLPELETQIFIRETQGLKHGSSE
jgi:hypothetical protein